MVETDSPQIGDVLNMDDAVDNLSPAEVKDVWARGQFMHQIIKANGPAYMRSGDCDDVQDMLETMSNAGIMQAAIHGLGRRHNVTQSLGWEDGPGNVETLTRRLHKTYEFDYDSDADPDGLIADLRDNIKSALNGCGMPRITVMRERVKAHSE